MHARYDFRLIVCAMLLSSLFQGSRALARREAGRQERTGGGGQLERAEREEAT